MYDAEDAWLAKDFPRARRCFLRILHVRPTHQAANERMAELFFIDGLQAEGLQHFDRLVAPPEFPIIDFRAAAACLITERFDQGVELAQRFLQRAADDGPPLARTGPRRASNPAPIRRLSARRWRRCARTAPTPAAAGSTGSAPTRTP
jgi:hypothetical protein